MRAERKAAPARAAGTLPVWRCKVCGYLCAREHPPGVCPICKAGKERFEEFSWGGGPEGVTPLPVWRCKVCGYLCAGDDPPEVCPVCKVGRERFEPF